VASWVVEAPDGWGNTPPTSPIIKEGQPGTRLEDWCFPCLEDLPLGPNSWVDLSIPTSHRALVTIEVNSIIEDSEGHSTCRSLVSIVLPFSP
jgi:hypothetical protein